MFSDTSKTKSPEYLFRNPHSYCFRLGVPEALRDIVGRREFRYSLRTGRLSEARRKSRLLAGLFQQLFIQIRVNRSAYDQPDVESKIQEFLGFVLQNSEDLPRSSPGPDVFTPAAGINLKRLVDEYVAENMRSDLWSQRTIKEYRTCLNLFLLYFDDVPLSTITYKRMRDYKDVLIRLPSNYSKKPEYRNLSLKQICDKDTDQRLSVSAINRYLRLASSLFRYAIKNGHMATDFAQGLKLPKKRRPDEERSIFTPADLEKLFYSTEYRFESHLHAWCFWIPILGLFTGARLEELCQLDTEDVRKIDGLWVLDINANDEKRLKNKSSKRLVPLHPVVTDQLRFPSYVERMRAKGERKVFPELRRIQECYGHGPSKWFSRYRKHCGVNSRKKTFHSFRHGFVQKLKEESVPYIVICELVGHSVSGELGRYGERHSVKFLYENAIVSLNFGLDWSHFNK